jgi:ketosteroid isomerase-like protein
MKILISAVASVVFTSGLLAYRPSDEEEVRQAVQSFHAAFNEHDFRSAEEYTTEDWNHINPFGGWTRGREAVLKELKEVHSIPRS